MRLLSDDGKLLKQVTTTSMGTMNDEHARYPGREDGSSTRNREPATPDKLSQKL